MKSVSFTKYQGTGNDFILIDNRDGLFPKDNTDLITYLCHRRFGIGSDGLILIDPHPTLDFEMIFYNPDGSQSFCGNGSRCAVAFAKRLGIVNDNTTFMAIDGMHDAELIKHNVRVKMADTTAPKKVLDGQFLHTGSPHYVQYASNIASFPVFDEGMRIRNRTDVFGENGTNVNFIEKIGEGSVFVRTFERGVENETLSCGTGVTASAIIHGLSTGKNIISVETPGGKLSVNFKKEGEKGVKGIYLTGPAEEVFRGEASIPEVPFPTQQ